MSQAISLQRPSVQHQNALQLEQDQRAVNSTWLGSASKVAVIALGVIASIASFAFLPVVSALLATGLIAVLGIAGLSCFSRSNPGQSHAHSHNPPAPTVPWYNRIFTPYRHRQCNPFYATSGTRSDVPIGTQRPPVLGAPRSDVPVNPNPPAGRGRGIFGGLGIGRGQNPPPGPGGRGTVPLGSGPNPPTGFGAPGGTVPLGSGHNPPVRPGGPGATVPLGSGHPRRS
jgi:hypothetical protein